MPDASLIKEYCNAVNKIKAVLKNTANDKSAFLEKRIVIKPQIKNETTGNFLIEIQKALTEFAVLKIIYYAGSKNETTERFIEPFAVYNNPAENWMLIAFCRLRKEFRLFRIDRIKQLYKTDQYFEPHKITLEEYIENEKKKYFTTPDTGLS